MIPLLNCLLEHIRGARSIADFHNTVACLIRTIMQLEFLQLNTVARPPLSTRNSYYPLILLHHLKFYHHSVCSRFLLDILLMTIFYVLSA